MQKHQEEKTMGQSIASVCKKSSVCIDRIFGKFLGEVFRIKLLKEKLTHMFLKWQSLVVKNG